MKKFRITGAAEKEDLEWAIRAIMYFVNFSEIEQRALESDFGMPSIARLELILSKLGIDLY